MRLDSAFFRVNPVVFTPSPRSVARVLSNTDLFSVLAPRLMLQSLPVGMMVSTDGILLAQDRATIEWTLDGVVISCLVKRLEQSLMSLNDNSTGTDERREP